MKLGYMLFAVTLAACASPPATEKAPAQTASARIADDVAQSMRELAVAKARYGADHPQVARLEAAQASLMQSGREASGRFDDDLREAVKYQLAIAQREGAEMELRYTASHPERVRNAAIIAALTE